MFYIVVVFWWLLFVLLLSLEGMWFFSVLRSVRCLFLWEFRVLLVIFVFFVRDLFMFGFYVCIFVFGVSRLVRGCVRYIEYWRIRDVCCFLLGFYDCGLWYKWCGIRRSLFGGEYRVIWYCG